MIQLFTTGEAFPNSYGVASINIPFIVDPNAIASDGSTGAFRPLSTVDIGSPVGVTGVDARPKLNTAAGYTVGTRVASYASYAQPSIDFIADPNVVFTGQAGNLITGGFRPKTIYDFDIRTIKNRTAVGGSGANYTGVFTDYLIAWTGVFTSRVTGILPNAASVATNQVFIVKDEGGSATTVNAIIVTGNGSTVDVGSGIINTAFGSLRLYSNGVNYFSW